MDCEANVGCFVKIAKTKEKDNNFYLSGLNPFRNKFKSEIWKVVRVDLSGLFVGVSSVVMIT